MISIDVKYDVKQQQIKEMVVVSYNCCKKHFQT